MSSGESLFLVGSGNVSVANYSAEDAEVAEGDGAERCDPRRAEEHEDEVSGRLFLGEVVEAAAGEVSLGDIVSVADVEGGHGGEEGGVEPGADGEQACADGCKRAQPLQRPHHRPVPVQRYS